MTPLQAFGQVLHDVAVYLATNEHLRAISELHDGAICQLALSAPPTAPDGSQILGTIGGPYAIFMRPVPLHPRPIEGGELRVTPPAHFKSVTDYQASLSWVNSTYLREQNGRHLS